MKLNVEGLTCIVTGPTSGIGRQTAFALVRRHAHVVLACRSLERGQQLLIEMKETAIAEGIAVPCIELELLDVSDTLSVRKFAGRWGSRPLHVLINNAGIFNFGEARRVTSQGAEVHMATNCWGPHLLTLLLLPALKAGAQARSPGPSRVVNVTSRLYRIGGGSLLATAPPGAAPQKAMSVEPQPQQKQPEQRQQQQQVAVAIPAVAHSSLSCYAASKFNQVALTAELGRQLAAEGAPVVCLLADPGEVLTDITRTLPAPLRWLYAKALPAILLTVQQGARSSVYAAGASLDDTLSHSKAVCRIVTPECRFQEADSSATDEVMGAAAWQEASKAHALQSSD